MSVPRTTVREAKQMCASRGLAMRLTTPTEREQTGCRYVLWRLSGSTPRYVEDAAHAYETAEFWELAP